MENPAARIPTVEDVQAAHARIGPYIHRTPVLTSDYLNALTGARLFFKYENFQKAGAFKAHGASNAVFSLSREQADDAARSLHAGRIIADDAPDTVADGLKVLLKERIWHFVSRHVRDILVVEESEIVGAMYLLWQRMKIAVEPSSAVALAAIIESPDVFRGRRVGVILTGGNVDLDRLPWMAA